MALEKVSEENKAAIADVIKEAHDKINALVGADCNLVLLIHPRHEKGECNGTAMFACDNTEPVKAATILNQALMVVAAHLISNRPSPTDTIN